MRQRGKPLEELWVCWQVVGAGVAGAGWVWQGLGWILSGGRRCDSAGWHGRDAGNQQDLAQRSGFSPVGESLAALSG